MRVACAQLAEWSRRSSPPRYSLILLPEDTDESSMTANNWSFHYTEKIDDGVWSSFSFH